MKKAYIVNYLKTDRSRNVQTVVVKAKSWDEAIEKADEEVGGFYDVGEIDVMSLAEAKRKSLLSNPMKRKTRCWKGYKPVKGKRPYSKGSCRRINRRRGLRRIVGNPRLGKYEQKALNFARKYPGWHGFDPRKPTANIVRRLEKKGLVKVSDISNQFRAI